MSVVETGFFTFKKMQIKRWSELRMQILSLAKINKQLRCEAALYCYLIPCYLTALTECVAMREAKGIAVYSIAESWFSCSTRLRACWMKIRIRQTNLNKFI
jgi:hypothetical protein